MPLGVGLAEGIDRMAGECARLVEPALLLLGAMQGYGNDQHFRSCVGSKPSNRSGKHGAHPPGCGMDAAVFERMDSFAHAAVVCSEGDGSGKRGRREAAGAAKMRGCNGFDWRGVERIAAEAADEAGGDRNFCPAGITNWNGRKPRQRGAAKSAWGGEERGTECVNN